MTAEALAQIGLEPGGRFDEWQAVPPSFLVADVDGTLVGPSGRASRPVEIAAARAAEAGIRMGFATGRMRSARSDLQDQLRLPGPHVMHNGAEVTSNGETIAAWPLSADQAATVLQVCGELDIYVEMYAGDDYSVSRMDERARPHWDLLGTLPKQTLQDATDLDGPTIKATAVIFGDDDLDALLDAIHAAGLRAGVAGSPVTPHMTYVNINHPDADKGTALLAAATMLDLPLDATAAIGDAGNDLGLLRTVGTAIAMGQSAPDVIAAAHLVAPSVDDDGVAKAIGGLISWRRAEGMDLLGTRS